MSQEPPTVNAGAPQEDKPAPTTTPSAEPDDSSISMATELANSASSDSAANSDSADSSNGPATEDEASIPVEVAEQGVVNPEATQVAADAADDSLESILLEAGARPQEPAADKAVGSRTLMGIGIEGLNLARFRTGLTAPVAPSSGEGAAPNDDDVDVDVLLEGSAAELRGAQVNESNTHGEANTPALIESKLTSEDHAEESGGAPSLLAEVAQALDAQAAEYRDRARGRLPGMPGSGPIGTRSPSPSEAAEFEDPEEGQNTSLTPGLISVVEDDREPPVQAEEVTSKISSGPTPSILVVPPPGAVAPTPRGAEQRPTDNRPTLRMPPVPGISASPASPTVSRPPGVAARPSTPVSGASLTTSGRVRLPTPGPAPGTPGLPLPSGRLTLPPGTMINPLAIARSTGDLTDTMPATPISIESSRRNTAGISIGRGSGRVSTRGNSRVTEPVIRANHSSMTAVTTLMQAHVKLATLNLAGLIAVTFLGGLFVGMLVWRGQGRSESASATRAAATPAASTGDVAAGSAPAQVGSANPAAVSALAGAAAVVAVPASKGAPEATGTIAPLTSGIEPVVAPLPSPVTAAASDLPGSSARKVPTASARLAARPRRPTPVAQGSLVPTDAPAVATASPAAKAPAAAAAAVVPAKPQALRAATLTTSKPMAANAGNKPTSKAKVKAAWHDPFAD